ncbi:MAG: DUF4236 domain-containing protein [Candidatus Hydrogenedentes bacterium]|nr:DUF4236 domain-containing protein [Candidatus Hydrogenedentota bacterium]
MGLRWRKSIGGSKGTRLNLSLRGLGLSFGTRGLRFGIGRRGPTVSAGIPGTGLFYFKTIGRGRARRAPGSPVAPPPLPPQQPAPSTFRPAPAMTRGEVDALNARQRPILIGFGVLFVAVLLLAAIGSVFEGQPVAPTSPPPATTPAQKAGTKPVSLAPHTIYQATDPIPLYNVPSNATIAYTLAAGGFVTTMDPPRGASVFQKVSLTDGQTDFEYYMDTAALKTGQLTPYVPPKQQSVHGSQTGAGVFATPGDEIVYIAPEGKKYHHLGCYTIRGGSSPISKQEAIARGYVPCKKCEPR